MSGTSLPRIVARPLGPPGSLAGDFLRGKEPAASLFPPAARGEPGETAAREARLAPEAFGVSPGAAGKLRRILWGEGTLVTTGQQPVLFLGPLYVLYKAIAAIAAARHVEAATGRPALALFWIASDDHDWEEVGTTHLIDTRNELRTLRLEPPQGWAGRPAGPAPLPEALAGLLDELDEILPESEFVSTYLELFRDAYRPGRAVADAFAGALAGVLEGHPFAWLDAASGLVKRAAVPLFHRALEEAGTVAEVLARGTARVREAGHEPRIPLAPEATLLFHDTGRRRARIRVAGKTARLGREGRELLLDDLLAELDEDPRPFSANVALRPVLESWLLPVGATVVGPGEIAYWTQLPEVFAWAGVPFPALRPRDSWILVESKVEKVLEKLEADPSELADGGRALAEGQVEEARPPEVEEALAALRAALGGAMEGVERAVRDRLPGIHSAVGKARSGAFDAVTELEHQVDARLREQRKVVLRQIEKAALHLYPDGVPQERRLNPLYYLARYGGELVDALVARSRGGAPEEDEPGTQRAAGATVRPTPDPDQASRTS